MEAQLDQLTSTYSQMCDSSTQQLQQLEQQLAKEEERKVYWSVGWTEMEAGLRICTEMVYFQASQSVILKVLL